jgi:ABC-type transport system involved in cytochrome c biogenesis permease subunit
VIKLLFALASLGYWAAALGFQYNLVQRQKPKWTGWMQLLLGSHLVHSAALLAWTLKVQHLPLTTMPESIAGLGWVLVALYAIFGRRWKVEALGTVAAPAAAVMTTFATFTLGHEHAVPYRSAWFFVHVGSLIASYGAFCLAAFCAALYFVQSRRLKRKSHITSAFLLPPLDTLDRVGFRFIMVGFPLMVLGIVSGTLISGWRWTWDTKETLVGVTCGVYLAYLHARMVSGWQGRRVNLLLLFAFFCVMISLLAPGRFH